MRFNTQPNSHIPLREEFPPMLGDCEKVDPAAGMRYIPYDLYP
jgi:hypothetical protein